MSRKIKSPIKFTKKNILIASAILFILFIAAMLTLLAIIKPNIKSSLSTDEIIAELDLEFPSNQKEFEISFNKENVRVEIDGNYFYSQNGSVLIQNENDSISNLKFREYQDNIFFRFINDKEFAVDVDFDYTAPRISNKSDFVNYHTGELSFEINSNEYITLKSMQGGDEFALDCGDFETEQTDFECKADLPDEDFNNFSLIATDLAGNETKLYDNDSLEFVAKIFMKCDGAEEGFSEHSVKMSCFFEDEVAQVLLQDERSVKPKIGEKFTAEFYNDDSVGDYNYNYQVELVEGIKYEAVLPVKINPKNVDANFVNSCESGREWIQLDATTELPFSIFGYGGFTMKVNTNVGSTNIYVNFGTNARELELPEGSYTASTLKLRDDDGNQIPWGSRIRVIGECGGVNLDRISNIQSIKRI